MAGDTLKKRRKESGLEVKDIADILRIKAEYLTAIENNAYDKLPVAVYTMGYIRAYAGYLDIEAEPLIQQFSGHLAKPQPATIIPVASSRKKLPVSVYAASFGFTILALFFLFKHLHQPQLDSAVVSGIVPVDSSAQGTTTAPISIKPASSGNGHTLDIVAHELTWVSVAFQNGKTEQTLFRPGNTKTFKFTENISIKIGNAGGARLSLDGRDLGTIGTQGQVVTLNLPSGKS